MAALSKGSLFERPGLDVLGIKGCVLFRGVQRLWHNLSILLLHYPPGAFQYHLYRWIQKPHTNGSSQYLVPI